LCASITFGAEQVVLKAEPIGKVEKFQGIARILSGDKVTDVTAIGQVVLSGDKIQTEQGEVEVKYNDGADLKVKPFSVISTVEKKETKGIFFKTTEDARRITAYVGNARFKSAGEAGTKKNYLQSPTAVCALRGSEADFGGNAVQTFLNLISGDVAIVGNVIRAAVPESSITFANQSTVFAAIRTAAATASQQGASPLVIQTAVLQATMAAAVTMLQNPDPNVTTAAKVETVVAQVQIAVVAVKQELEKTQAAATAAQAQLAAATTAGDPAAIANAQAAVTTAQTSLNQVQTTLNTVTTTMNNMITTANDSSLSPAQQLNKTTTIAEEVKTTINENVVNKIDTTVKETVPVVEKAIPPPPPAVPYENQ